MRAATAPKFTGWHMLTVMVVFFGVIITVNFTMAYLATSTWSGLLAKNGYSASIDYKRAEEIRKVAADRGWTLSLSAPAGTITLSATDAAGKLLAYAPNVEAAEAASGKNARTYVLTETAGTVRASETLPAGRWALHATVGEGADALTIRSVVDVAQ